MKCPSCHYEQPDDRSDCEACGLIFAKWRERHSGVPAPVPQPQGTLEIRGNLITGYFWYEFVVRQLFWVLMMLFVVGLVFWHPFSPYGYWFLIVLVLFYSLFYLILWIPRRIALLDAKGFTFAEPWSWAFLIPRWYRVHWKDVERVKAGPRISWQRTDHPYRIVVEVRSAESGEFKQFTIVSSNKHYLDFVRYVGAKVDQSRIDGPVLSLLEPKTAEQFEEARRYGMRMGTYLVIPMLVIYFLLRMDRWQKSFGDYFWVVVVIFVALFGQALYRIRNISNQDSDKKEP